jgi:hypothetical protein
MKQGQFEGYKQELQNWKGEEKTISHRFYQTKYNRLNIQIILDMWSYLQQPLHYVPRLSHRDSGTIKASTYMVAAFECTNGWCSKWFSGKVYTEIYFKKSCFHFNVIVWNQQCRKCKSTVSPTIDESIYLERVISKLKLWMGLRDQIKLSNNYKKTPPHHRDLCCACQQGRCEQNNRY